MSLLTELEELKGTVSYKYFAPNGAEGPPLFGLLWRDWVVLGGGGDRVLLNRVHTLGPCVLPFS